MGFNAIEFIKAAEPIIADLCLAVVAIVFLKYKFK